MKIQTAAKICFAIALLVPLYAGLSQDQQRSGTFSVLTYNVAGLPEGLSGSHPIIYHKQISPLLGDFDLVLVQEDFFYHRDLTSLLKLPYISENGKGGTLGDGLARFSIFPFTGEEHVAWEECHGRLWYGSDCLTPKGFYKATHTIAPGVLIDVYDLHMDAGEDEGDSAAKAVQVEQLAAAINGTPADRAVIVAGDFNLHRYFEPQRELLNKLLAETHLKDSRVEMGDPEDTIDRILYRSSESLKLTPIAYKMEMEKFVTAKGKPLSDHEAVSVRFGWEVNN